MVKRKATTQLSSQNVLKRVRTLLMQKAYRKKRVGVTTKRAVAKISKEPFPLEWRTKFTWAPVSQLFLAGANNSAVYACLNGLYDPDAGGNYLGNGQPLYFDQALSATGPYQKYRVNGWKIKLTLSNATTTGPSATGYLALDAVVVAGAVSSTDVDTYDELLNLPGRQTALLTARDTPGATRVFYINGKLSDYISPNENDDDYVGSYQANPSNLIYLGIGLKNAYGGDTTAIQYYAKIQVEYDVTLYARDGVQS